MITSELFLALFLPFFGTLAGASLVFIMKKGLSEKAERAMTGFAGGVMVAASVWSLLLPAIERSAPLGSLDFIPAAIGFLLGVFSLLLLDRIVPQLSFFRNEMRETHVSLDKRAMLVLSVTLHNIPEGMAVGVLAAARMAGDASINAAAVITLALGIAIQNFPEGAIISLPLESGGVKRSSAFLLALLSAIAELFGAVIALLATAVVGHFLPYFLSFAAGAMVFVVVEELIPDNAKEERLPISTIFFTLGFCLMMVLDVALG